jgi:hypothetical protein
MRAYKLFRHEEKPHLVCAVPENHDGPDVVAKPAWRFERKLTEPAAAPLGFDPAAAAGGVQLNGFYLFQSFDRPDEAARPRQPCAPFFSAQAE